MKYASHSEGSRRVIFKLGALLIAVSFQAFPVLTVAAASGKTILVAADDEAMDSATSSSSTSSKPATANATSSTTSPAATVARTTITTASTKKPALREHAGATIINDDTTSGEDSDQTTTNAASRAAAVSGAKTANDKLVPVVEYTETPATVALCKQAVGYSNKKQYAQAISVLTQAITRDPRTIEARRLYAQTTLMNNEPDRAISVMLLLAQYTKPTVTDKCLLASAYYAKNNSTQAVTTFKDATQLAPDNFYAEEGLLKSILLQQDYSAAASECTSALARFKYPSAQIAIRKIYAQVVASRNAAKANELQPGDSRLSPPIPLPELTPYVMQQYGG